jgi:NAD(P)-dependent dehydrogenase (short-subunit alcohol dehydrogenase family)
MLPSTIIIGGSGGIGSALARRLASHGARLHLIARDAAKLAALATETGASTAVADVTRAEELAAAIAAAGPVVNGLAYAVGTINLKPVGKLAEAEIEYDFRLNALGAFTAVRAALPALKLAETTSSIVLFSSIVVSQGFPEHASIAMAKGAVEGLTLALAAEFAPKIRVNCIAPSLTRTNLAKALTQNEPMAAAIAALHPLGRLGEPEDIAALAGFLLSGEAGWMTGQIIGVDGGRSSLRGKG